MVRDRAGATCVSALCIFALALGFFFRFHNVGLRVPFEDEAMTWLRVSGHTEAELNKRLYDGRLHSAGELSVFQRHTPDRGIATTVLTLVVDDPEHAPLYFVLEHAWSDVAGDALSARRMVSVLAGLGFIAAFACLCLALFQSVRAALIGASLAALSPLQIVYSQQAREYELWAFSLCVWSVVVILAARRNTVATWIAYAICAIVAFYVSLLSLPLLFAHAIWIAARKDGKTRLPAFAAAAGAALLAYFPWLLNLASHRQSVVDANTWSATPWPLLYFTEKWAFNLSATFFDLYYADMRYAAVSAFVLVLILFACIDMRRRTSSESASFIVLLGGVSAAVFLIPDLLFHEHRSLTLRYVLPVFIAVQTAVVGMLAGERCSVSARRVRIALFALLVMAGAWSAFVRSTRASWWENNKDAALPAIARTLDSHLEKPLLAEDGTSVLALINLLDPRVRIRIVALESNAWLPSARRGAFVLTPSRELRARLQRMGLRLEPIVAAPVTASLRTFRSGLPQDDASVGASLDVLR